MVSVTGMTADSFNNRWGDDIISGKIEDNNHLYLKSRRNLGGGLDAGEVESLTDFRTRLAELEPASDEGVWHYVNAETGEPRFDKAPSLSDFGNYGDPWQPVRFRKDNGFVLIEGLIKMSLTTSPINLFKLPVGFRPSGYVMFVVNVNSNTGAASTGTAHTHPLSSTGSRVIISADGTLTYSAPDSLQSGSHLSLSGIQFYAETA